MHRLVMTSTAYRQSSHRDPARGESDASGTLYSRYSVRRLEAEAVRDRILVTAGRLDRAMFGPAVVVTEDAVGQVVAPDDKPRRSVYLQARRTKPVAFMATFDAPAGELNCDRRGSSTAAPQALMLMNSDFILRQASHFARRLREKLPVEVLTTLPGFRGLPLDLLPQRVARAWELAYQRPASPEEVELACRFVRKQTRQLRAAMVADPELAALTNLCQQLLAANEFLYVD